MAAELHQESDEPALLAHLLLVDDGTLQSGLLEQGLIEAGFLVTTADDAEHTLELLLEVRPDLLVRGADVLQTTSCQLRRVTRETPSSPPPLPEGEQDVRNEPAHSEPTPPTLDLDSVMQEVERLIRSSLLPPPMNDTDAEDVAC